MRQGDHALAIVAAGRGKARGSDRRPVHQGNEKGFRRRELRQRLSRLRRGADVVTGKSK